MNVAASKGYEVSVETVVGLERRMVVRVPTAEIEREIAARLAKVGRTAKLKGFRPGKVPQKIVRQYYGGRVRDEVLGDVIRASYSRAIAEQKLNPAGGPKIETLTDAASADSEHFSYRATFEVYPEIKLQPLENLTIEVPKVEIAAADVETMLEKLRAQRGEWRAVDRGAAEKDRVVVDFVGTIDGEPFQGGEGKGVSVVVGAGQVLPEFDQALHGVAAGESTRSSVQFPQNYGTRAVAGKNAEFAITVLRVEEQLMPALDDELATAFGVAEGGVDALRTEARKNMERELTERRKSELKTRCFDALIAANQVVVPRALVEQEIGILQAEAIRQMGLRDPQQAPARERFRPLAERRATVGLLVQELLKQHKIKLDQVRVEQRLKEIASAFEKPEEAAQYYRSNRGMMTQLEAGVLEDQVVDFLLGRAQTKDRQVTFEEFMAA